MECTACKVALDAALWKYRTANGTYPGLPKFIISMCEYLKIETRSVCTGMIHLLQNETLFLLQKLQLSGTKLCGLLFPTTCPGYANDLSWNHKKWVVPVPKPHLGKQSKPSLGKLKVLQLSDIHIDLQYKPGSHSNCKEPLCCRSNDGAGLSEAGFWGTAANCDTPYWTFENLLQHVSKQKFDYILWTGDLPAHNDWNQSRTAQIYLLNNLTNLLTHYFPTTPVYPALGNHESSPVNSFPPNYITGYNSISWLYDTLAKVWAPWLSPDAIKTVKQSGFYTMLVKPGLRMVSLNMNYCNSMNFWMLLDPADPNGELAWLVQTLAAAEENGEVIKIGGGDCLQVWRNNYHNIVARFSKIIAAQFFGHTHKDEIEIQYNDSTLTHPISMAYISPSSPHWEFEYSAKAEYNLTSLSLKSWHQLYQSWLRGSDSFLKYYRNYYKGNVPSENCDTNCRLKLLCLIQTG
uniref:Sphingomyelin phosphodiesterase n=1 Tax=Ciona savignyi TaxID=51511 RepID=H2Y9D1_CIOSA